MNWTVAAAAVTGFSVLAHFILAFSPGLRRNFLRRWGEERGAVRWVFFRRIFGVLFFGLVPLFAALAAGKKLSALGLNFGHPGRTLLFGAALAVILVVLNVLAGKNPANLAAYPEIRLARWTPGLLAASAAGWAAYLVAYEFLFRGFFLFPLAAASGIGIAAAVNTAVYTLAHLSKGWRETIGAIPLGIVFCLLCFEVGNIWPAVLAHLSLALSNEWLSLSRNPEMAVAWKK